MVWLIAGLVLAATVWLFMKARRNKAEQASAKEHRPAPHRHAWGKCLTIPPGVTACAEAQELERHCFALGKVPKLPLAGCTHGLKCHCHFVPVDERRSHVEKRSGIERRPTLRFEPGKVDRRSGRDRRDENRDPFAGDDY